MKKGALRRASTLENEKYFLAHFLNDFDYEVLFSKIVIIVSRILNVAAASSKPVNQSPPLLYKKLSEEVSTTIIPTEESNITMAQIKSLLERFSSLNLNLLSIIEYKDKLERKQYLNHFFMLFFLYGTSDKEWRKTNDKPSHYKNSYVSFHLPSPNF